MSGQGLPLYIKAAVGFLLADVLWLVLLLAKIGSPLWRSLKESPLALAPLLGLFAWFGLAAVSILGLLRRSHTALRCASALLTASALGTGALAAVRLLERGLLPPDPPTLVVAGGFACFVTPLVLLLAGRRAYFTPSGGVEGD